MSELTLQGRGVTPHPPLQGGSAFSGVEPSDSCKYAREGGGVGGGV